MTRAPERQLSGRGSRPSPEVAYARWTQACTRAGWRCPAPAERVPLTAALGRVTARPVAARWAAPRFDCAAMDGIAVSAAAAGLAGPGAGQHGERRLASSSFAWVDTGEPLPPRTDTVLPHERVRFEPDGSALISGPAQPGQHVRARGEDFGAGQTLIPAGHRLRPIDLAAAAAGGHTAVAVARAPVVAIIPTGDEIRPAGVSLGPADITDSNSVMLAAQASVCGARAVTCSVQPDDPGLIAAQVRQAARDAQLVLVIAGSSEGHRDHTAAVLAQTGAVSVRGAAVRPGHPVLLGYALPGRAGIQPAAVPVIGVPGYPLAAAVIFELFAAPLLAALQGLPHPDRARRRARLACDWTSAPQVEDWVPVTLQPADDGGDGEATALATPGRRGAGSISRLLRADGWWPIPIGESQFARGDYIEVRPVPGAAPGESWQR